MAGRAAGWTVYADFVLIYHAFMPIKPDFQSSSFFMRIDDPGEGSDTLFKNGFE